MSRYEQLSSTSQKKLYMKLIATLTHWLGRQFLSLLVIVSILLIGGYLYSGIQSYIESIKRNADLQTVQRQLPTIQAEFEAKSKKRMEDVSKETQATIDRKIIGIGEEISGLESQRRSELDRNLAFIKGDFRQDIERELHIDLLKKERTYLEKVKAANNSVQALAKGKVELERKRQFHINQYSELKRNEGQQAALQARSPIASKIPGTTPYYDLKLLETEHSSHLEKNQAASEAYWSLKRNLDLLERGSKVGQFEPARDAYNKAVSDLQNKVQQTASELAENWISRYVDPALDVLPMALSILLGAIFTPIAIKGIFFYIIAPFANQRPAICLTPQSSGELRYSQRSDKTNGSVSSPTVAVTLSSDEELLVHPEYLRSMAENSEKSTKWLLDWRYPLTSIASGLYVLTRLRAEDNHSHTISALEDPLAEVALIEIPDGTNLILQPQHLVGVIQLCNQPLRIKSHWRLNSVTAWLTLQLRYMVFSGPVKIVVKGCRGVRVDPVATGQSINQAATMGFTGNLSYAVTRCDPFVAYVRGKQELFNDKFTGDSGYYISEEMPNLGKKSGITGKGLEGLVDSARTVFGV